LPRAYGTPWWSAGAARLLHRRWPAVVERQRVAYLLAGPPLHAGDPTWRGPQRHRRGRIRRRNGEAEHAAAGYSRFRRGRQRRPRAVVCGGDKTGGLVRPDGRLASPDAADALAGHSLVRTSDGWQQAALPTPNACLP